MQHYCRIYDSIKARMGYQLSPDSLNRYLRQYKSDSKARTEVLDTAAPILAIFIICGPTICRTVRSKPQSGIDLARLYVPNVVWYQSCCHYAALLHCSYSIKHANADDQAEVWPDESNHCVSSNGCSCLMCPSTSPYPGIAGFHLQRAYEFGECWVCGSTDSYSAR